MKRACPRCGTITAGRYCQAHGGSHTGWSPSRNRQAQQKFRDALMARANGRCETCGAMSDLRACHIVPLHRGGGYSIANGRLLCKACDIESDPYAR